MQGILLALEQREQSVGEVFNLGGGEVVTINQAMDILAELTGKSPQVTFAQTRPGDQRCTVADISKAQRILGYTPTTSVSSGLRAQVKWQRDLLKGSFEPGTTFP